MAVDARAPADPSAKTQGPQNALESLPVTTLGKVLRWLDTRSINELFLVSKKLKDSVARAAPHSSYTALLPPQLPDSKLKDTDGIPWPTESEEGKIKLKLAVNLTSTKLPHPRELRLEIGTEKRPILGRKRCWWAHPYPPGPSSQPSQAMTDYVYKTLDDIVYFSNRPINHVVQLSLEGLIIQGLTPDYLGGFLPHLSKLRLSACAFDIALSYPVKQSAYPPSKIKTLRLEHPDIKTLKGSEHLRTHYPTINDLSLWFDPNSNTGSIIVNTLIPGLAGQLQRLCVGSDRPMLTWRRSQMFLKPTLTLWSESLSALTHLNVAGTGWMLDDWAVKTLIDNCPALTHLAVQGIGLRIEHTARWKKLTICLRLLDFHLPSIGMLKLPHPKNAVTVLLPADANRKPSAQPLRLAFSDLTPTVKGDIPLEEAQVVLLRPIVTTMTYKTQNGDQEIINDLFVVIESENADTIPLALESLGPKMKAIHMDKGVPLYPGEQSVYRTPAFMPALAQHAGHIEHLSLISITSLLDTEWPKCFQDLPKLKKLTLIMKCTDDEGTDILNNLLAAVDRPFELVVHEDSVAEVKDLVKGSSNAKKWVTVTPLPGPDIPAVNHNMYEGPLIEDHPVWDDGNE